jgi:putative iron-only hydrogenase system regulator
MQKRLGFVGILVHNRKKTAPQVNNILTEFGDLIIGRMGIPHVKREHSVIVVIVDASTDELGALTGKLGKIDGVSVKSALSKDEICNTSMKKK